MLFEFIITFYQVRVEPCNVMDHDDPLNAVWAVVEVSLHKEEVTALTAIHLLDEAGYKRNYLDVTD